MPTSPPLKSNQSEMLGLGSGWLPEVAETLLDLLNRAGSSGDLNSPPYAVFDWDDTCIMGDAGDAIFYGAVTRDAYPLSDPALWEMLTDDVERSSLLQAIERMRHATGREKTEAWIRYRWQFVRTFGLLVQQLDDLAYGWQTMLLAGLTPSAVEKLTRQVLDEAVVAPLDKATWPAPHESAAPIEVQQGIRPFSQIKGLYDALEASGIQVWIVSATGEPIVRAAAAYFGYDPKRVIATRLSMDDGRYAARLLEPYVWNEGKVKAIQSQIHPTQKPALVVGDGLTDHDMLEYGGDVRIVIDHNLPGLREQVAAGKARGERWLLQPPFPVE